MAIYVSLTVAKTGLAGLSPPRYDVDHSATAVQRPMTELDRLMTELDCL